MKVRASSVMTGSRPGRELSSSAAMTPRLFSPPQTLLDRLVRHPIAHPTELKDGVYR